MNQSHEVDSTVYSLIEFFLKNKSESDFFQGWPKVDEDKVTPTDKVKIEIFEKHA